MTAFAGILLAWWPTAVHAHLVTSGLGPLYDGFLHFAMSPEDLGPALALALLAGLRGAAHGRRALFILPAAWAAAGVIGLAIGGDAIPILAALSFVFVGALVAADARLPLAGTSALAVLLGFVHGYANGVAMARLTLGLVAMVGIVAAVFSVVALASSFVVPLRAGWPRVAVRVAGSWIAAIGILLLGWGLRSSA